MKTDLTAHLPHLKDFPLQREMLSKAVALFNPDDRVLGVIVAGSIVQGGMDEYSDIDLNIIVRDEAFDDVFGERDKLAEAIDQPLFRFLADHLRVRVDMYIVLYKGPVKLDLDYMKASELRPEASWGKRRILKDTDGFLAGIVEESRRLATPSPDHRRVLNINQKFWTWCWYVFGKIQRGEYWEAFDGLHGIRTLALLPLFYLTQDLPEEGYRRLEQKMLPEMAGAFRKTAPSLNADDLREALQSTISLFRDLRREVSQRYGLRFDEAKEEYLRQAIDSMVQRSSTGNAQQAVARDG